MASLFSDEGDLFPTVVILTLSFPCSFPSSIIVGAKCAPIASLYLCINTCYFAFLERISSSHGVDMVVFGRSSDWASGSGRFLKF